MSGGPPSFADLLVALDGSTRDARTLAHALERAQAGARLTLLHVVEPPHRADDAFALARGAEAGRALVERAQATLPAGQAALAVVRPGRAADEILARAEFGDHDAIVLGALGRVAREVIRGARVPVLLAHGEEGEPAEPEVT